MENTSLHTQKVVILSRLIKESSLTLEEALLLLKEEEVEETPVSQPKTWSYQPYITGSGTLPLTGTGTSTGTFIVTTAGSTSIHNNSTTLLDNVLSTPTADLNN
jgi:hypothetical protein